MDERWKYSLNHSEHGISPDGKRSWDTNFDDHSFSTFFSESESGVSFYIIILYKNCFLKKFVPRAVMIDTEPMVVDGIKVTVNSC